MKRPMTEVEKNFLQCAAILVACALAFFVIKWKVIGIIVCVLAAISLGIGLWMFLFTEGYKDEEKKPSYLDDQRKLGQ